MSKFALKPGLSLALLPMAGKVAPGMILEGDQYRKFVPQFLVEVVDLGAATPAEPEKKSPPPVIVPPPPAPAPAPAAPPPSDPKKVESKTDDSDKKKGKKGGAKKK